MPDRTKIATCSYCGTRAVLNLAGARRHELSCTACGAVLHDMKPLRTEPAKAVQKRSPRLNAPVHGKLRPQKRKKNSLARRLKSLIEDVVDEVEDLFD